MASNLINAFMSAYIAATSGGGFDPGENMPALPKAPPVSLKPPVNVCEMIADGENRNHPDPQKLPPETFYIKGKDGNVVAINVEVARTPKEMAIGLMYREEIPEGTGMLFVDVPKNGNGEIGVWMKDTYVPLDIVFLDKDGNVVGMYENVQPCDLDKIMGGKDAHSILELPAGSVELYGIDKDDRLLSAEEMKLAAEEKPAEEKPGRPVIERPSPVRPYDLPALS